MKPWVPAVLVLAGMAAAAAAPSVAGSCTRHGSRGCANLPAAIDLSSVPDISNQIVSGEDTRGKPQQPAVDLPEPAPYTGPIVGVNTNVRAPTVGYYWSIQ